MIIAGEQVFRQCPVCVSQFCLRIAWGAKWNDNNDSGSRRWRKQCPNNCVVQMNQGRLAVWLHFLFH